MVICFNWLTAEYQVTPCYKDVFFYNLIKMKNFLNIQFERIKPHFKNMVNFKNLSSIPWECYPASYNNVYWYTPDKHWYTPDKQKVRFGHLKMIVRNSRISRIIFKIQGLFKDLIKFWLKKKDFSRISRVSMKFKDFKDFLNGCGNPELL